jgi:putative flippase GtrA
MIRQFVRFNLVGMLGAGVQLLVLRLFTSGLGIQYVTATAFAVEIALLHNFGWHEMWTWGHLPWQGWPARLLRFQLGNGATSLASNVVLTFALHEFLRLPVVPANLTAIVTTSLVNFSLARLWVFRTCGSTS